MTAFDIMTGRAHEISVRIKLSECIQKYDRTNFITDSWLYEAFILQSEFFFDLFWRFWSDIPIYRFQIFETVTSNDEQPRRNFPGIFYSVQRNNNYQTKNVKKCSLADSNPGREPLQCLPVSQTIWQVSWWRHRQCELGRKTEDKRNSPDIHPTKAETLCLWQVFFSFFFILQAFFSTFLSFWFFC